MAASRPFRATVAVLVVVLVALAGCTGGMSGGGDGGGAEYARQSADATDGGAGSGGSYYENGERIVLRDATMRVQVESFDPAFREAREIAGRHGGYVAGWHLDIERGWTSGRLEIKVPAGNFSAARDDLATLGRLEQENVNARDFTAEYENREERIEALRRDAQTLERLLERANDTDSARALYEDLRQVREEIRELESQQRSIERREALSTITLVLAEPESDRPPRYYESAFGFEDAFLDAFYGGLTVLKYVVVVFGYAIPVGLSGVLLAGFALICYRLFGRLRVALDAVFPGVGDGWRWRRGGGGDGGDVGGNGNDRDGNGNDRGGDDNGGAGDGNGGAGDGNGGAGDSHQPGDETDSPADGTDRHADGSNEPDTG